MKTEKFEFVEGLLICTIMGISVPVAVLDADTLAFPAGETAILVALVHIVHLCILGGCVTMEKGIIGRVSVTGFTAVMSALVGVALFRCLCVALGAGVDYASIAGGTVIGGVLTLSMLSFAAVADVMKSK